MEAVKWRPEHRLTPPGNARRQPALGQPPQDMLVAEATHLPLRMNLGQEWIARLDRVVHRYPVTLGAEQMAGQVDASPQIQRAIEGVPAAGSLKIQLQVFVRQVIAELLHHMAAIEAHLIEAHGTVDV